VTIEALVRSLSGILSAANALPIVGVILIRLDLHALTKCKADKSHQCDEGEQRHNPMRHHLAPVQADQAAYIADSILSPYSATNLPPIAAHLAARKRRAPGADADHLCRGGDDLDRQSHGAVVARLIARPHCPGFCPKLLPDRVFRFSL
jgi:hypothetical protein